MCYVKKTYLIHCGHTVPTAVFCGREGPKPCEYFEERESPDREEYCEGCQKRVDLVNLYTGRVRTACRGTGRAHAEAIELRREAWFNFLEALADARRYKMIAEGQDYDYDFGGDEVLPPLPPRQEPETEDDDEDGDDDDDNYLTMGTGEGIQRTTSPWQNSALNLEPLGPPRIESPRARRQARPGWVRSDNDSDRDRFPYSDIDTTASELQTDMQATGTETTDDTVGPVNYERYDYRDY